MPALAGGQSGLDSIVAEVAKSKDENRWVGAKLIAYHADGIEAARGLFYVEGDAVTTSQDTHAFAHNGGVAHEKLFTRVFLDGAKPTCSIKLAYCTTTATD
jgi:hypothetical protein